MAAKARSGSKIQAGAILSQLSIALTALLSVGVVAAVVIGYPMMERKVAGEIPQELKVVIEWPPLGKPVVAAGGTGKSAGGKTGRTGGTKNAAAEPAVDAADAPTTWLSEPTQQDLTRIAMEILRADPFDRQSLRATAEAFEGTGWFKRIEYVRREPGGVVRIKGQWRVPGAVVRRDGVDYLVSTEGERLPVEYKQGRSGLVALLAPNFEPPLQGQKWVGGDVQAGMALMAYLQTSPAYSQVRAIDLSQYGKTKRLAIVTDRNNRVVWGTAPGEFNPNEPDTKTKLRFLATLVNSPDFGHRIDANKPVIYLTSKSGVVYDSTASPSPPPPPPPPTGSPTARMVNDEPPDDETEGPIEGGMVHNDPRIHETSDE